MGEDELQITLFEETSEEQFKEFKKQNDEKKKEIVKLRIAQEKANQEAAAKENNEKVGDNAIGLINAVLDETMTPKANADHVHSTEEYPDQVDASQSEIPEGINVNISTEGTLAKVEVKDANKK